MIIIKRRNSAKFWTKKAKSNYGNSVAAIEYRTHPKHGKVLRLTFDSDSPWSIDIYREDLNRLVGFLNDGEPKSVGPINQRTPFVIEERG